MKRFLTLVCALALLLCLAAPLSFAAGMVTLPTMKFLLLLATVVWLIAAPLRFRRW